MNIIFTIIFIIVALVIFATFRDNIFGVTGFNPINIILSVIFLIVLWHFLRWIYNRYNSLNTLSSIADAREKITIKNKKLKDSNSNNFTISSWFYINDWNYKYGSKKILLQRGTKDGGNPEIYFSENENNIIVKLHCYKKEDSFSNNITNTDTDNNPNSQFCYENCGIDYEREAATDSITGSQLETTYKPCSQECLNRGCIGNPNCVELMDSNDSTKKSLTGNVIEHECEVRNVPLQKWVNLIISVYGRTLDIYIDGKLVRTCVLPGIVKVNTGEDLHITPDNGFNGFTSNTIYRPTESNPQEAYNIYYKGYGSSWFTSIFNRYKIKVSLLKDSIETNTFQI